MYKIVKVTNHEGKVKEGFMAELQEAHPEMKGVLLYPINKELVEMGTRMCFIWADESDKMLRTSVVEDYEETGGGFKVVTRNSIYFLEEV